MPRARLLQSPLAVRAMRAAWLPCLVIGLAATLTARSAPAGATADSATITHVLNRTGFGPAPGQVERVRAMGIERYLETQLHPETLPDAEATARLAGFDTLALSSREISERYYAPALELRQDIRRAQAQAGQPAPNAERPARPAAAEPSGGGMADPAAPAMNGEAVPEGPPAGPLANLPPAERRRAMELRRQSQKVLQELGQQKLLRAVYSERQLQEVLVDFWFNHFNVFAGKGPVQAYLTEYERDVIRPHVLGHFRELLGAVAHSPAMLFYLDNWQSSDPGFAERGPGAAGNGQRRRPGANRPVGPGRRGMPADQSGPGIDRRRPGRDRLGTMSDDERERALEAIRQRMPRGLNENYARELLELHTLGVDGGYTQADIVEVAKAFTGWTIRGPRQGGAFWFDERRHVKGAKHVLGAKIDRGGERDGEAVLDLIAAHPSTATFIATKLARRFVADTPPPALVQRAAETFTRTRGDLREVTRTILASPEFVSAEARRAKVKTPFEFVASALRTSGSEITGALPLLRHLRELGMPLYFAQPPTGYADRADAWVNTGALLARMNFALALVGNRIPGVRTDLDTLAGGGSLEDGRARLLATLLAGDASESTRATLARGTEIAQVAALTLGSPEFQRR